ncbi:MAG: response regulator, partial [Limnochordia bacterium]
MNRILVVDNNVELCSILAEFFDNQTDMETAGVAYDGEEALVKLTELQPDVMILDITMPHLDGIGVLERMAEMQLSNRPRIIVLTAFSRDELLSRLTELGVDYFIVKPFNLSMLADRIREFAQERTDTGVCEGGYQDLSKYQRFPR